MVLKILAISYYLLFFLTPLLWTSWNHELFEFNKMMFVYLMAVVITGSWMIRMVWEKRLILKRTPLDIPILLFLLANIASTIFSIDPHTSIFGYYSRLNGGLLSTISYTILYFALVSNFSHTHVIKFLKAALLGGVAVSLYAIPEHFGVSPSCVILRGEFSASCWVQDVSARVFATLGQPNWLSGYLAMLIFPALYLSLTSKLYSIPHTLTPILLYLAFTFTYSRGGALGFLAGMGIFITSILISPNRLRLHPKGGKLLISFLLINLVFGSALFSFKLFSQYAPPPRPTLTVVQNTQLESGGDETGNIRLVVWQGALDIFKHYPIFGSGLETFAYSYYQFRPIAHNLTSEWDFLYNKAHNEFLNYLATTGILGFGTYISIIIIFILWNIRQFKSQISKVKTIAQNSKVNQINSSALSSNFELCALNFALLSSYISYLVQNFFGFSVAIIALFFFLFPALSFMSANAITDLKIPKGLSLTLSHLLYKRSLYPKFITIGIIFLSLTLGWKVLSFYLADVYFAQGEKYNELGKTSLSYGTLEKAVSLNPAEPLYKMELGFAAAAASVSLAEEDATESALYKQQTQTLVEEVLRDNPQNISLIRSAVRVYYLLSTIDDSYSQQTISLLDKASALAPTDPKLPFNKAVLLSAVNKNQEAVLELNKAINLKPNYRDAYFTLATIYLSQGNKAQAVKTMEEVIKINPNDTEALEKIKKWGQ